MVEVLSAFKVPPTVNEPSFLTVAVPLVKVKSLTVHSPDSTVKVDLEIVSAWARSIVLAATEPAPLSVNPPLVTVNLLAPEPSMVRVLPTSNLEPPWVYQNSLKKIEANPIYMRILPRFSSEKS